MTGTGLPHSETLGSKRACRSPRLIAACRVLHRLLSPRHPSCALTSLTTKNPVRIRCRDTSCGGIALTPVSRSAMHLARPSAVPFRIASDRPGVAVLSPAVMPVQLSKSRRSESSVPKSPALRRVLQTRQVPLPLSVSSYRTRFNPSYGRSIRGGVTCRAL